MWIVPADYRYINMGHCRGCGALITWAASRITGRADAFDRDGTRHLSSCPRSEVLTRSRGFVHAH